MKALSFIKRFNPVGFLISVFVLAFAWPVYSYMIKGSEVRLDTSDFDGNLSSTTNTAQKLADVIDQLSINDLVGNQISANEKEVSVDGKINAKNILDFNVVSARSTTNPSTLIDRGGVMRPIYDADIPRWSREYRQLTRETSSTGAPISGSFEGSWVDTNGALWATWTDGLYKSTDGGATLVKKDSVVAAGTLPARMVYQDSRGYLYWSQWGTGKIRRSIDGGESWADVCTHGGTDSGIWGFTEDNIGYLYAGVYTGSNQAFDEVWRSIDGGLVWTKVYDGNDLHIHDIKADPYTGYIYFTHDIKTAGDTRGIYRSVDHGANWTRIWSSTTDTMLTINFLPGMRLFGVDADADIYKTTDDSVFTKVYETDYCANFASRKYGDEVFFTQISNTSNCNPKILKTSDGATFTTVWQGKYIADWSGPNYLSNFGPDGYAFTNLDHNLLSRNFKISGAPTLEKRERLLLEEARTNYALTTLFQSDANSDGIADNWTNDSGVAGSIVFSLVDVTEDFKLGTTVNAQRIQYQGTAGDTDAYILFYQDVLGVFAAGDIVTVSFYIKTQSSSMFNPIWARIISYDSEMGNAGNNTEITYVNSEWQRVSSTLTVPASSGYRARIAVQIPDIDEGDVIDMQITAAQMETGSQSSSYIPTSSAAVSRAAESIKLSKDNVSIESQSDIHVLNGNYVQVNSSGDDKYIKISHDDTDAKVENYGKLVIAGVGGSYNEVLTIDSNTVDDYTLIYPAAGKKIRFGEATAGPPTSFIGNGNVALFDEQSTATTDGRNTILFQATTTGSASDGYGPAFLFKMQDNSGAATNLGQVAMVRDGADNTGKFIVKTGGTSNANLTIDKSGFYTFGAGVAGRDYTFTVDGETNDGVIKWMEDEDHFAFQDNFLRVPPAAQTIAAGNTITDDACGGLKQITAAGAVTTSTTDTFTAPSAGNTGCCMDVCNVGAENITLDNNANFKSIGGADIVMTANDCTRVCSNGTAWYSVGSLVAN